MEQDEAKWIFDEGDVADIAGSNPGWAVFHCSNCGHRQFIRDGQFGFYVPRGMVLDREKVTPLPWKRCEVCGIRMRNCDTWMDDH